VEINGLLGVTEQLLIPLSRGTTVVSFFRNVNAVMSFYWVEDETVRLNFDPLFAFHRFGVDSDSMVGIMEQVGFDLRAGEDRSIDKVTEAAFALTGYLTGVHLSPEILQNATYLCGFAAPPAD
jgi:hypothetical protein